MEAHRRTVEKANRRSKAAIVGLIVALATAAAATVYAVKAHDLSLDQVRLQEQFVIDRDAARIAACTNSNVEKLAVRLAVQRSLLTLARPGVPITPEQQTTIDAYNKAVNDGLPFRDCSPGGIAAYYRNPPSDPAVAR